MELNFNEYRKVKLFKNNSGKRLTNSELEKFNEFIDWVNNNIQRKRIILFYRGTNKTELKDRIKAKYILAQNNPWMNYLFLFGEKSKSYRIKKTDKNESTDEFLNSIQDLSEHTFKYIFDKIREILQDEENDVVKKFNQSNPGMKEYFTNRENCKDFIDKAISVNYLDKFKIRNYYLRLIHTISKLGKNNEYSCFVSTTTDRSEADNFANSNDGVIILYWLPQPINRFGLSLGIVQQMAQTISELQLPLYFSEFYPKENEFSVLGALFRGHIIGYLDRDKLVINPHILNQDSFNDETIENGIETGNIETQSSNIEKFSNFGRQVVLYGNTLFRDKKL